VAETIATTLLCPWEALRIKSVADPGYARNLFAGMARIGREEGFAGYYRGLLPILSKQLPYTVTQLTVFSTAVDYVYSTALPRFGGGKRKADLSVGAQLAVTVACGMLAGVTSSIASQPGDTVLTRINATLKKSAAAGTTTAAAAAPAAAAAGAKPKLPPVSEQIAATVRSLGWRGLWIGTGPRAAMTAALSAGMFLVYDSVKLAVGLPSSGGGH
jgi:solute carrier family 25 phosphate transporter 3